MNEVRLIDANALKERLLVLRNNINNVQCTSDIFDICLTEVSNTPTIPQTIITEFKGCGNCELERPQGEWVRVIDYSDEYEKRWHYECSECKNAPYYCGEIYKLHFCPNCGADMRKENKDGKSSN